MAVEKQKTLAEVLHGLRTGKNPIKIGTLSDFDMVPVGLSTGNIVLDTLTGVGGLPKGRVVEMFGKPSSGKTTTALQAAANLQRRFIRGEDLGGSGGNICYWDFERTLDEKYVRALGIDTEHPSFIYYQPRSFEDGANRFRELLATGEVGMVIHDSVAKMVTENELAAKTGEAKVADRAKMMHQYMRQIVDALHDTDTCAVFLNHVMDLVDASPMGQKLSKQGIKRQTTPAGMALPFYSSLRMEFKPIGNIRDKVTDPLTGLEEAQIRQVKVQATVVKNKVGDPFGSHELRVRFGRGFSNEFSVFDILRSYGVFKVNSTGYVTFPDDLCPSSGQNKIQGENNIIRMLEEDPGWFNRLEAVAIDLLRENGVDKIDPSGLDENGVELEEAAAVLSVLESEGLQVNPETGEIVE